MNLGLIQQESGEDPVRVFLATNLDRKTFQYEEDNEPPPSSFYPEFRSAFNRQKGNNNIKASSLPVNVADDVNSEAEAKLLFGNSGFSGLSRFGWLGSQRGTFKSTI